MMPDSQPILTCEQAARLEAGLFHGDETREWAAMQQAGRRIAGAILDDTQEIGGLSATARILVLVGKGHNGGDALIAAADLTARLPGLRCEVVFVFGERALRPLAARAYRGLQQAAGERLKVVGGGALADSYELTLDGIFGFQFRPPVDRDTAALLERVNALPIRFRAAVDLPSGGLFRADFTYATGSVKANVVDAPHAGRVRWLDLGFFPEKTPGRDRVLAAEVLAPLAGLRSVASDKRSQGHLFVVGGSRHYPGAILMTVLAALRSGVGLVTACVPESLTASFAARAPEAMWVGWPETPDGGLALEGFPLLRERIGRATALAMGPGMGREPETLALATEIVGSAKVPVLLDADALQRDVIAAGRGPLVLTPHAGEFARIVAPSPRGKASRAKVSRPSPDGFDPAGFRAYCRRHRAVVVLKGPLTRVSAGSEIFHSWFGGPVLARGGSGDLLAGLVGGLLAQSPQDPLLAACRGAVWHGIAADLLARKWGHTAVQTTQLLDFLSAALRESRHEQ